jgi:hypothetical protein
MEPKGSLACSQDPAALIKLYINNVLYLLLKFKNLWSKFTNV